MEAFELGRLIQSWATIIGATIGAFSFLVAAFSLRLNSKTNKAKFVFDVTESFLKEPSLKSFWYKLDYDSDELAWKFDLKTFRHSEDERIIDTILYKFGVIGRMLKSKAIEPVDVIGLFTICRQLFHNKSIRDYLYFIQLDFFCSDGFTHLQFEESLYCYEQITKQAVSCGRISKKELEDCLTFIERMKAIPYSRVLQKEVAASIGYTLHGHGLADVSR